MSSSHKPLHETLPNLISRSVDTTNYQVGIGQLQALMGLFRQTYIPGNWDAIEDRCHNMAAALDRKRTESELKIKDQRWFSDCLAGLHRSEQQHAARQSGSDYRSATALPAQGQQSTPSYTPPNPAPVAQTAAAEPPPGAGALSTGTVPNGGTVDKPVPDQAAQQT